MRTRGALDSILLSAVSVTAEFAAPLWCCCLWKALFLPPRWSSSREGHRPLRGPLCSTTWVPSHSQHRKQQQIAVFFCAQPCVKEIMYIIISYFDNIFRNCSYHCSFHFLKRTLKAQRGGLLKVLGREAGLKPRCSGYTF